MSGRNATTIRTLMVLGLLEKHPQGMTIDEIHSALEDRGHKVDKRTVYRDRDALTEIGFPIYEEEAHDEHGSKTGKKRLRMDSKARVNEYLVLNTNELFALYFAKGMLKPLENTPFFQDISEIFNKIESKLGKKAIDYISEIASELKFAPTPKWGIGIHPDIVDTLRSAIQERQMLQIEYQSANSAEKRKRKLGPHFLYFHGGSLYLVAEDLAEAKLKTFAVPRISQAEMLNEPYDKVTIEPETHFQGSFGIFKGEQTESLIIEFSPKISPYVKERGWHKSQHFINKEGGVVQLKLEVAITPELIGWILGFGPDAKVIQPPHLAEQVTQAAQKIVEQYKTKRKAA